MLGADLAGFLTGFLTHPLLVHHEAGLRGVGALHLVLNVHPASCSVGAFPVKSGFSTDSVWASIQDREALSLPV